MRALTHSLSLSLYKTRESQRRPIVGLSFYFPDERCFEKREFGVKIAFLFLAAALPPVARLLLLELFAALTVLRSSADLAIPLTVAASASWRSFRSWFTSVIDPTTWESANATGMM